MSDHGILASCLGLLLGLTTLLEGVLSFTKNLLTNINDFVVEILRAAGDGLSLSVRSLLVLDRLLSRLGGRRRAHQARQRPGEGQGAARYARRRTCVERRDTRSLA